MKRSVTKVLRVAWPVPLLIAYVVYGTGPALSAQLSLIDDHAIPFTLGPDRSITWPQTLSVIRNQGPTWANRFLPVHFTMRAIEMKLRGFDARGWHLDRIVMGCLCVLCVYVAAACFVSPLAATAVALASVAGLQRGHIFVNLGYHETTGLVLVLPGAALIALGVRRGRDRPVQLLPGLALILLAGGCKESFVPLLPAALAIVYGPRVIPGSPLRRRLGWRRSDWLVVGALVAANLGIVVTTLVLYARHGHPYAGTLTAARFLDFMDRLTLRDWHETYWPVALLGALCAVWIARHDDGANGRAHLGGRLAWLGGALAGAFVLLALPQCLIYGTSGLQPPRYAVPGHLFIVLAVAMWLWVVERARAARPRTAAALSAVVSVSVIAAALVAVRHTRAYAREFTKTTHQFHAKLAQIERLYTQTPGAAIVLHVGDMFEFEPVFSVRRYLSVGPARDARFFLDLPPAHAVPNDPFAQQLLVEYHRVLDAGGDAHLPLARYTTPVADCIGVTFGSVAESGCRHVVPVVGLWR